MDQQQRLNEAAEQFTSALVESYRTVSEGGVAAQERGAQLTEDFFSRVLDNLRSQAEDTRQMTDQLADRSSAPRKPVERSPKNRWMPTWASSTRCSPSGREAPSKLGGRPRGSGPFAGR